MTQTPAEKKLSWILTLSLQVISRLFQGQGNTCKSFRLWFKRNGQSCTKTTYQPNSTGWWCPGILLESPRD